MPECAINIQQRVWTRLVRDLNQPPTTMDSDDDARMSDAEHAPPLKNKGKAKAADQDARTGDDNLPW